MLCRRDFGLLKALLDALFDFVADGKAGFDFGDDGGVVQRGEGERGTLICHKFLALNVHCRAVASVSSIILTKSTINSASNLRMKLHHTSHIA